MNSASRTISPFSNSGIPDLVISTGVMTSSRIHRFTVNRSTPRMFETSFRVTSSGLDTCTGPSPVVCLACPGSNFAATEFRELPDMRFNGPC